MSRRRAKQQTTKKRELSESESESSDDSSNYDKLESLVKKQKNINGNFNDTNEIDSIVKREKGSFLVKLRLKSYWDTVWMSREELSRKATFKLLWFENNYGTKTNVNLLKPEWTKIDYFLAEPKPGQYLVKWKDLSLSNSTLETKSNIISNTSESEFEIHYSYLKNRKSFQNLSSDEISNIKMKMQKLVPNFKHPQFELMNYQKQSLEWLFSCWRNCENCILSDEPGLGKTVQAISFLSSMKNFINGPFLIVSPPQRLSYWVSQLQIWSPDLMVTTFVGSNEDKQLIKKYLIHDKNSSNTFNSNVILTTFDNMILDESWFKSHHWPVVVIDQAHKIRNSKTKSFSITKRLQFDFLLLISDKIYSETLQEYKELMDLAKISPNSVLRREKSNLKDVFKPNSDKLIEVPLSPLQKYYIRKVFKEYSSVLCEAFDNKIYSNENKENIIQIYQKLLKTCQHPYLNIASEDEPFRNNPVAYFETYLQASSKLLVLEKMLEKFSQDKVVIFSSFPYIIEELLLNKKYRYSNITSENISNAFTENIALVNHSTKLVPVKFNHYDYIILFDSHWNPNIDTNKIDRFFTIGKNSTIIRLVCCEGLEKFELELSERECLKGVFSRKISDFDVAFRLLSKDISLNDDTFNIHTFERLNISKVDIDDMLGHASRFKVKQFNRFDGITIPVISGDIMKREKYWHHSFGLQSTKSLVCNNPNQSDILNIPLVNPFMSYDVHVAEKQDEWEEFPSEYQYMNIALDLSNTVEALVVDVENIKKALEKTVETEKRKSLVQILQKREAKIEEESMRLRIYSRQMKNPNIRIISSTNVLVKGFTKYERLTFYQTISRYGLGIGLKQDEKWQQFYSIISPKLREKSITDIKEFGIFIFDHLSEQIEQNFSHYSDGTPTDSINGLKILQRIGSMFLICSMCEKYSQFSIESSSDINYVESILELNGRNNELFNMEKPSIDWKIIYDLVILRGCSKHGFAMWNEILLDSDFEFTLLNTIVKSLFQNSRKMIIDFLNERLIQILECLSVQFTKKKNTIITLE